MDGRAVGWAVGWAGGELPMRITEAMLFDRDLSLYNGL